MLGGLACYVRLTANALELSGWSSLRSATRRGVYPNGAAIEPMWPMLAIWMPAVWR